MKLLREAHSWWVAKPALDSGWAASRGSKLRGLCQPRGGCAPSWGEDPRALGSAHRSEPL